jgi:hypothetical protein
MGGDMYLAPLNYDRFFKKVFSDLKVAKAFLEDFLKIKIEEIEVLKNKHYITDQSIPVEFDYRCKLDSGEYIIIEMQQWYKTDVIKRFYLYHSLSTSVQLETMEVKTVGVNVKTKKLIKDKFYNDLKPVITLIWMVDDELGFKEDFVSYKMTTEELINFVKNERLWLSDSENILKERRRVIDLEQNKTKGLDFIFQNKLIFMFQKNIVENNIKNKKIDKYIRWFNFADLSKNKENKESDFEKFKKDKLFVGIINKLLKNRLTSEEIKYITDEEEFKEAYEEQEIKVYMLEKEIEDKQKEVEDKQKEVEDKQKEVEDEKNAKKKTILKLYKKGFSIKELAEDFEMKISDIEKIIKNN